MARNHIDLWFTNDGDFAIDANGDLKDTSSITGRSTLQEIRTRLRAVPGDWLLNPGFGANIESFLGESATSATIAAVGRAITESITFDGLASPANIEVIPIQISKTIYYFRVIIQTSEGELTETFGYDSDVARFIGY